MENHDSRQRICNDQAILIEVTAKIICKQWNACETINRNSSHSMSHSCYCTKTVEQNFHHAQWATTWLCLCTFNQITWLIFFYCTWNMTTQYCSKISLIYSKVSIDRASSTPIRDWDSMLWASWMRVCPFVKFFSIASLYPDIDILISSSTSASKGCNIKPVYLSAQTVIYATSLWNFIHSLRVGMPSISYRPGIGTARDARPGS